MPYNQQQMYLQWLGTWHLNGQANGTAIEQVTGGMRFAGPGLDQADADGPAIALSVILTRYWGEIAAQIPGNCFLESVKWNRLDVDGHYDENNTRLIVFPPKGGAGAAQYPTQVSWATTWLTDAARGPAARGRTYWPTSRTFDGNTMKVTAANCSTKASLDAQLVRDLKDAARNGFVDPSTVVLPQWAVDLGFQPATVREGSGVTPMIMSKLGNGTSRVITGAGVGDRLDIQRRRANQMSDVRQTVEV